MHPVHNLPDYFFKVLSNIIILPSGLPTKLYTSLITHLLATYLPIAVIAQSIERWATDWTIGVLDFDSQRGLGTFFFTTASRTVLIPTQPSIQWVRGALSPG
jgi:hypothetical protein